jgi:hypothetical protein
VLAVEVGAVKLAAVEPGRLHHRARADDSVERHADHAMAIKHLAVESGSIEVAAVKVVLVADQAEHGAGRWVFGGGA